MADVAFEVKQDALAVIQNTVIEANFDECKAALTEMMKPYQSMIVTEDGIAAAKNDRARIRKVASGIDDMRKNVKKLYSEPLAAFEGRCKELISICTDGADNLDKQIKDYEQHEAEAKIDAIRAVYDEGDAEVREFCPWESVCSEKWKNKGYSFDAAKDEILTAFKATREDVATIRAMDAQDVPALLLEYKRTRNLAAVVRMSASLKQAREELEKRKAEEAEFQEAQAKALKEKSEPTGVTLDGLTNEKPEEPTHEVIFKVWATERQLMSLKGFLRANGIKYGRP